MVRVSVSAPGWVELTSDSKTPGYGRTTMPNYRVSFVGELTTEEEQWLSLGGFRVHRNGAGEGRAGIATPARHVVLNVEAADGGAAVARVERVIGRQLEDVRGQPVSSNWWRASNRGRENARATQESTSMLSA